MAHENQNLAIFRGKIKFKNNQQKIWGVFILLSIITIVEVALGIIKPEVLTHNYIFSLKILNWIFLALTLVKAYYITWDFMHMRDEVKFLRRIVVWTCVFYILYLVYIVLEEGDYIFEVLNDGLIKFNF